MPEPAAVPRHAPAPGRAVADRLGGIPAGITADLAAVEAALVALYRADPRTPARDAVRHLLAGGGKRLRPLLCLLCARVDGGPTDPVRARLLARAAELVHDATLLHDDVIDEGDVRRGRPTARIAIGNAASVLGGDLLLVEALAAIHEAAVPGALETMLEVLRAMVNAEALQLDARGRTDLGIDDYFRVCSGKTGSLFGWAAEAGGRAGLVPPATLLALRRFGREVGIAFQIVDDLLDLEGDPADVGKSVLQDVMQGTLTLPVLVALREEPNLARRLAEDRDPARLGRELTAAVERHGGAAQARRHVAVHTAHARRVLGELPCTSAARTLRTITEELAARSA